MASKMVTRQQAESKRQKAVDFLNRIGQSDSADEFAAMSTDEYAEHKGLTLTNPKNRGRRQCFMPNGNGLTKTDLEDQRDRIQEILEDAYDPESSREDLAAAIGQALDVLSGEEEDEDEGPEEDEDEGPDEDDDDSD